MQPLKARDPSLCCAGRSPRCGVCCLESMLGSMKQRGQCDMLYGGGKENVQTCLPRPGTLLGGESRHGACGLWGALQGGGVAGERGIFLEHPLAYCKFCGLCRFHLLKKRNCKICFSKAVACVCVCGGEGNGKIKAFGWVFQKGGRILGQAMGSLPSRLALAHTLPAPVQGVLRARWGLLEGREGLGWGRPPSLL